MPDDVTAPVSETPAGSPDAAVNGSEPDALADVPAPPEPSASPDRPAPILAVVPLDLVLDDDAFRLRPPHDVESLARSMAQFGQLYPVEVRPRGDRYQVVAGFRRLDAVRLLRRPRILARVHAGLGDDEALLLAVGDLCQRTPVDPELVAELRDRLERESRLGPRARAMIEAALATAAKDDSNTSDAVDEEVELDALCADVTARLAELNQDLAAIVELWEDVDAEARAALLEQLRYPSEIATYLEGVV